MMDTPAAKAIARRAAARKGAATRARQAWAREKQRIADERDRLANLTVIACVCGCGQEWSRDDVGLAGYLAHTEAAAA